MKGESRPVLIKTIADYHLEEYMRCPFQFYYRHLLGKGAICLNWRQMAQHAVHQVIHDFYKSPLEARSSVKILELIHKHWMKRVDLFHSRSHYFTVLGEITNNLLFALLEERDIEQPLFLFEKFRIHSEELQIDLAMTLHVAEWSADSFILRKYMVDAKPGYCYSYKHMAVLFSEKAFGLLPEKIEIIQLLNGKKFVYYPERKDLSEAIEYFQLTKDVLKEPHHYKRPVSFAECGKCPFIRKCHRDWVPSEKETFHFLYE